MKTPPPAAPAAGPPTWPPSAPPSSRPSKTPATCTSPKAGATTPPQPKPSTFTASIKTETDIHGTRRSPDRHPRLVAAAQRQLERVTLVSRAFDHDQFGPFCAELAALVGMDMVLPMNTGAEAVETGIKTARKWGYEIKGVPAGQAVIVTFEGNFHGRTTTIVSFSTDEDARASYGPYTPGFRVVPYGDPAALAGAMDERVVGVLIEPIQGEAGVIVPPPGYLAKVRELCSAHGALLIADEIQSGLGRTGTTFACDYDGVVPDMYVLGKALGGGIVPLSAVVSSAQVLGVFKP